MRKYIQFLLITTLLFISNQNIVAQTAPAKVWDKTFGGNNEEELSVLMQTSDGGYILGGHSSSGISGDKTVPNKGILGDYWIVKLDAQGNKLWDKSFGGDYDDQLYSIQQTSDGGFILGGNSLSGLSGDKSQPSKGNWDYWVVKLDSNGNKLWDKAFGGSKSEALMSLQQTADGGYILGGSSDSDANGDKTQICKGTQDYWIVKVDASGNKTWDKSFGGQEWDRLYSIKQTSDGGYILGGESKSNISFDKTQPVFNQGYLDYWVIKLDSHGIKQWDKTLGGSSDELLRDIQQTSDGGFIIGGFSHSSISGDKSQALQGNWDYWIVKLNAAGNKQWDKAFGGNDNDALFSLQQTFDGGFIIGGRSSSPNNGDKSQASQGGYDYWILKLDSIGNKSWDKSVGGTGDDLFSSIRQTFDGGYILGGSSDSNIGGDKSQLSKGGLDYWVLKLDSPCSNLGANLTLGCNNGGSSLNLNIAGLKSGPAGTPMWSLTYTLNGVTQTTTGTTNTHILTQNAAPGSIYTLVSITSGSCTKALNQTITIQPIPLMPTVISGKNCGSGQVTLTATGAPTSGSYIWYNVATGGAALQTDTTGIFSTPVLSATTTFFVAVANNAGCEGPRTPVNAIITSFPISAGADETVCVNAGPVQLSGFSPAGGIWSGSGVSSSGIFTPDDNLLGSHILTYSYSQTGCTLFATKNVAVLPVVQFSLGQDLEACEGESVILQTDKQPGGLIWNDGSKDSTLLVLQSGKYWVRLIQNGCVTSDTIQVTFKPCPPPFIPNIITQNHDTKNDTFKPQNLPDGNWQLQVYNRWGVKVYESKNYQNNWPEKEIASGTYYYLLSNPETNKQYKGWVEVTE